MLWETSMEVFYCWSAVIDVKCLEHILECSQLEFEFFRFSVEALLFSTLFCEFKNWLHFYKDTMSFFFHIFACLYKVLNCILECMNRLIQVLSGIVFFSTFNSLGSLVSEDFRFRSWRSILISFLEGWDHFYKGSISFFVEFSVIVFFVIVDCKSDSSRGETLVANAHHTLLLETSVITVSSLNIALSSCFGKVIDISNSTLTVLPFSWPFSLVHWCVLKYVGLWGVMIFLDETFW